MLAESTNERNRGRFIMDIKIFAKSVEKTASDQIHELSAQPAFADSKIRIMPDVHAGAGCVIGFTGNLGDKVIPNIVGVDIGCGMLATRLEETSVDFSKLDSVIKERIPAGMSVRQIPAPQIFDLHDLLCYPALHKTSWIDASLGTLGGGNHFIELDSDSSGRLWLVIHSGSRNLGKQIADIYQDIAIADCSFGKEQDEEIAATIARLKSEGRATEISKAIAAIKAGYSGKTKLPKELCYVSGKHREDYLHDMRLAQRWAVANRERMRDDIFAAMGWTASETFCTKHNYIGDDNIIRKGAIAAYGGERVIIPMNMRDGSIMGTGKGNPDWNFSAPHGAGRLMSRTAARATLKIDDFQKTMEGVYTTTDNESTIDEAPMAYKPMDEILSQIGDAIEVNQIIKPVYNFKAADQTK